MASEKQIKARKLNWAKLQIIGAAIGLNRAAKELGLSSGNLLELEKTIRKLETTMLNQLEQEREVSSFANWQAEASSKK